MVGLVAYHWTDAARPEPLSEQQSANRELMVYVWYPAARSKATHSSALYLPEFQSLQKAVSAADLEDLFRPAYAALQQFGYPPTHTIENSRMPHGRYPVLVFSHGLGFISALYTAELEDLASHGYVVAAIDHPYDTTFTRFPDGRFVTYAQDKWDAEAKKPDGYLIYVKERIEVWAADTRFVIDQLIRYDKQPALGAPFAGHLDLARLSALGHSVGGLVSVRAAQVDSRIRACLNQDSDIKNSPFVVATPGQLLKQPFLFLIGPVSDLFSERKLRPTDEALARMKLTRAEYDALFTHRSFSDLPLLAAGGDAARQAESLHNFQIAQAYTRGFFDKYLKGRKDTLLDLKSTPDPRVRVERFGSAQQRFVSGRRR